MTPTSEYSARIETAARWFAAADFVLIGAGAGLSAAAGLRYQDPELFQRWYPQFVGLGPTNIWEGIVAHWAPHDLNRERFWAFWAHHIQTIRYDAPPGAVYRDLAQLVAGKEHFVLTTNVDGQFAKTGFPAENLFTPQGDYGKFQCLRPCNDVLHGNAALVQRMLTHLDREKMTVRAEDIPRCPNCGDFLERNLRRDSSFVEAPHLERQPAYMDFIGRSQTGRLLLLEFGVGFNTPGIIRWPFERLAARHPGATLVRVNVEDCGVPEEITSKALGFQEDAALVVRDLVGRTVH